MLFWCTQWLWARCSTSGTHAHKCRKGLAGVAVWEHALHIAWCSDLGGSSRRNKDSIFSGVWLEEWRGQLVESASKRLWKLSWLTLCVCDFFLSANRAEPNSGWCAVTEVWKCLESLCNNFSLSLPLKGKLGADFSLKGFLTLGRRFLADDGFTYPKIPGRAQNSAMKECWQLTSGYSPFSCAWAWTPLNPTGHWYHHLLTNSILRWSGM